MKGADERDLVLGRLLGVSALARSGRLGSEPEVAEGALKVTEAREAYCLLGGRGRGCWRAKRNGYHGRRQSGEYSIIHNRKL